jgi:hypothetical protein
VAAQESARLVRMVVKWKEPRSAISGIEANFIHVFDQKSETRRADPKQQCNSRICSLGSPHSVNSPDLHGAMKCISLSLNGRMDKLDEVLCTPNLCSLSFTFLQFSFVILWG